MRLLTYDAFGALDYYHLGIFILNLVLSYKFESASLLHAPRSSGQIEGKRKSDLHMCIKNDVWSIKGQYAMMRGNFESRGVPITRSYAKYKDDFVTLEHRKVFVYLNLDKGKSVCSMCTKLKPHKSTIVQSLRQCTEANINQPASIMSIFCLSAVVLLGPDGITPSAVPTMPYGAALYA